MKGMKDIENAVHLARLQLSQQELNQFQAEFDAVLNHFDAISEVPTEGIEPLYTPILEPMTLRKDIIQQFNNSAEALENAPELQGRLFRVPPVV